MKAAWFFFPLPSREKVAPLRVSDEGGNAEAVAKARFYTHTAPMRGVFKFLKRAMLILVGLTVAFFTAAFIIIDPPPYPYFDPMPYFNEAYEEFGCEGADEISRLAWVYSQVGEPRARFAQMIIDGDCSRDLVGEFGPEQIIEDIAMIDGAGGVRDGSLDEHIEHYSYVISERTSQSWRLMRNHISILLSKPRQKMLPNLLAVKLRCPNMGETTTPSSYWFRHSVADIWEAEELRMPEWEARWQECSDHIVNLANYWEENEVSPPTDSQSAELLYEIAFLVELSPWDFFTDELWDLRFRWSTEQYATYHGAQLWPYCPASWDEYSEAYNSQLVLQSHRTVDWIISNNFRNNTQFHLHILGDLRERGYLLPQSDVWAYYWFRLAQEQNKQVDQALARIAERLGSHEIQSIDTLIANGQMPSEPSEYISRNIREAVYYYFQAIEDGREPNAEYELLLPHLRQEELLNIQSLVEQGEPPSSSNLWEGQLLGYAGDRVDCETGEAIEGY